MRPIEPDYAAEQDASLRSMSAVFASMGTPFGEAVARDLKDTADRLKWAGEPLPLPALVDAGSVRGG